MVINTTGFKDRSDEIVCLFEKGDKKAFELLYDQYAPLLLGVIFRIVKDRKMAELALSKAFLQIWQNRGSYYGQKGNIIVWLLQFGRNAAFSLLEKKDADVRMDVEAENQGSVELLDMVFIYGKSPSEICQLFNISQRSFAAHIKTAIENQPHKDLR